jgi:hypothetical protein
LVALHIRKKSTRLRSVEMRPWVVLTTIGKKQIRNVMIVTLFSPGPTHRMRIGAMTMIGVICRIIR